MDQWESMLLLILWPQSTQRPWKSSCWNMGWSSTTKRWLSTMGTRDWMSWSIHHLRNSHTQEWSQAMHDSSYKHWRTRRQQHNPVQQVWLRLLRVLLHTLILRRYHSIRWYFGNIGIYWSKTIIERVEIDRIGWDQDWNACSRTEQVWCNQTGQNRFLDTFIFLQWSFRYCHSAFTSACASLLVHNLRHFGCFQQRHLILPLLNQKQRQQHWKRRKRKDQHVATEDEFCEPLASRFTLLFLVFVAR